jgi:hypothetical protein
MHLHHFRQTFFVPFVGAMVSTQACSKLPSSAIPQLVDLKPTIRTRRTCVALLSFRRRLIAHTAVYCNLHDMTQLTTRKRERLSITQFACPIDRKLPINDAAHVRAAMARFDQVISDECHPQAAKRRILAAARKFHIDTSEFMKVKSFKRHKD